MASAEGMNSFEHIACMFNKRTQNKKYENYVVNAIYAKVGNYELIPVTQQCVHDPDDPRKYYLIDLYFPQLNYGVEVDEGHHNNPENHEHDQLRSEIIMSAISCRIKRISVVNPDSTIINLADVNAQTDEKVSEIKSLIKERGGVTWKNNDEYLQEVHARGEILVDDSVWFGTFSDVIEFCTGKRPESQRRCVKKIMGKKLMIWSPTLSQEEAKLPDNIRWVNRLNEDKTELFETDLEGKCEAPEGWNDNGYERVIFIKMKNEFGKDVRKFIGVFKAYKAERNQDGSITRHYERISDLVKLSLFI